MAVKAAPTYAFVVGVAFIVYVIGLKKLSKHSIKRAYYSWKAIICKYETTRKTKS